jgi:hypothetical protein
MRGTARLASIFWANGWKHTISMLRREQKENHCSKVDGVFGLDTMDTGHFEQPAEMGCQSIIKAGLDSSLFYLYLLSSSFKHFFV